MKLINHKPTSAKRKLSVSNRMSIILVVVLLIAGVFIWLGHSKILLPTTKTDTSKTNVELLSPTPSEKSGIDQAASLYVVANKGRVLPANYIPANLVVPSVPLRISDGDPEMQLRSDTAAAMQQMFASAKAEGINLMLASGYRSYDVQVGLYNGYVKSSGQSYTDNSSARPGHSEHQTGLAADIEPANRTCEIDVCFADTPEGKWLAANAYKYGFIIRYQAGKDSLTGYEYEPWHIRYLGNDLAAKVYRSGKTLEQYFSLPSYPDYPAQIFELR